MIYIIRKVKEIASSREEDNKEKDKEDEDSKKDTSRVKRVCRALVYYNI